MTPSSSSGAAESLISILGWLYFTAWSISFYPQSIQNWKRRSTAGQNIGFPIANLLGFAAYTTYTACMLFSPLIQRQYAIRQPNQPHITVRINDFAFAAHGLLLSFVLLSQFVARPLWGWPEDTSETEKERRKRRMSTWLTLTLLAGILLIAAAVVGVLVGGGDLGSDPRRWGWIDVVYVISYFKLLCSTVKLIPQVILHYQIKSTHGWHISQSRLDMAGSVLSVAQLVLDSMLMGDDGQTDASAAAALLQARTPQIGALGSKSDRIWAGILGNAAKFWLGNLGIIFEAVILWQRYVLYGNAPPRERAEALQQEEDEDEGEREPLLRGAGSRGTS